MEITLHVTEENKIEFQRCDPLEGFGDNINQSSYYRVDSVVFAEPLNPISMEQSDGSSLYSMTILNENVTVRRKSGKGKNLYIHLQDQSKLSCPMADCLKIFSSPTLLRTHIRKVHYSEKKYTCEVCGASFTALYLLRRHSAVHGAERVQCPVCKKMLSVRTNLPQHLRSHSDTRRHECSTCGKRFLRSATLRAHIKGHKDTEIQTKT